MAEKYRFIGQATLLGCLAAPFLVHAAGAPAAAPAVQPRLMVETAPGDGPKRLAMSPDGRLLGVLRSEQLQIREVRTGRLLCIEESPARGNALTFSKDGLQLASSGERDELLVWDTRRCGDYRTVASPLRRPKELTTLPDGRVLVSGDEGLFAGDLFGKAAAFSKLPAPPRASPLTVSLNGSTLLLEAQGRLLAMDLKSGQLDAFADYAATHEKPAGSARRVAALSPDGRWAVVQSDGTSELTLYDRQAKRAVASAANSSGGARSSNVAGRPFATAVHLEFSVNGEEIAAVYNMDDTAPDANIARVLVPAAIHVLKRADLSFIRTLPVVRDEPGETPLRPTFHEFSTSADGRTLAMYGLALRRDGLALVDLSGGVSIRGVQAVGAGDATDVAWTPDGALVVLNSGGARVKLADRPDASPDEEPAADAAADAPPESGASRYGIPSSYVARWDLRHSGMTTTSLNDVARMAVLSDNGLYAGYSQGLIANSRIDFWIGVTTVGRSEPLWRRRVADLRCASESQGFPMNIAVAPDGKTLLLTLRRGASARDTVTCLVTASGDLVIANAPEQSILSRVRAHFSADGRRIDFLAQGAAVATYDVAGKSLTPGAPAPGREEFALPGSPQRLVVTADAERHLARREKAGPVAARNYAYLYLPERHIRSVSIDPQGKQLAVETDEQNIDLFALAAGDHPDRLRSIRIPAQRISALRFSADGRFLAAAFHDGSVWLWEAASGALKATLYTFADGTWAVVDPQGRFDTNDLDDSRFLSWVTPDEPLHGYPLAIFMRDYFEPRLLTRILGGEKFSPVRPLADLNKAQPGISILSVKPDPDHPGQVSVAVQAENVRNERGQQSGIHGLHLFRDHHLVGVAAEKADGIATDKSGKTVVQFTGIHLASGARPVQFAAYAFNADRVKSETAKYVFTPPRAAPSAGAAGRAFIISIGVNDYENPTLNLGFAVSDARATLDALTTRLSKTGQFRDVIGVALVSEPGGAQDATKAHVEAAVARLAGKTVADAVLKGVPNADKLSRVTPDDLVVVSFSGHGYADEHGGFYLIPQEVGRTAGAGVTPKLLKASISSEDWAQWLQPVDAGDLAMIIDACHSAASIEGSGFKPGPMGSRGLGQLAYDKGIRMLTASQAADVALESNALQHGLLTYSLVIDGIDGGRADFQPVDRQIDLLEWLSFGVERVPRLYDEISSGTLVTPARGNRGLQRIATQEVAQRIEKAPPAQLPSLFDFNRGQPGALIERL